MALTAKQFSPIQKRNEWSSEMKASLKRVLDSMPGANGVIAAAPVALTDSTGGAVSNTLAAITAGAAYAQADATATKNAIASLSAKVNAIRTALINAGIMT